MPKHFTPSANHIIDTYLADEIEEATSGAGVTVDGVLLKDAQVSTDVINEKTSTAGVTIDGVLLKDSAVNTDTVNEKTSAAGVTVDGMLIKDGRHSGGRAVQTLTATGAITLNSGLVLLAHNTVVIASTLDAPTAGDEIFIVNSSASGTAAHTVTLANGVTLDSSGNDIATLDAPGEALHMIALSATRWLILENIGSVGLSGA